MLPNNSHRNLAWFLFAGIVGGYLLMAVKFPHAYILATYEDLVGEWAQVFLFTITMLLAARQAYRYPKFRWFFALLAIACFYVAGEEISWGQRLFDIQSPEFFEEHNLQGETNLHNFFTGPISTLIKHGLEIALAVALTGYGLVYPWLLQRRNRLALWFEGKGLAAPPLYLCPFFVFGGVLELGLIHFNEAEIAEILIPLAMAIMTLAYGVTGRKQADIHASRTWQPDLSRRLAKQTGVLIIVVLILATGTTLACYSSPRMQVEMTDRYYNGVEKFAGRYKRIKLWGTALQLYQEIAQEEPDRASVQRSLYRCHIQLEMPEQARQHFDRAIEIDLQRLANRPTSVSANISLVKTYQLVDSRPEMQKYLQQALSIGLAKKAEDPDNPGTAYWLGKSYTLKGDCQAAYQEFQRAVHLRPDSLKYKKALLAAERKVTEQATL